jgi:hypothetical protein
LFKKAISDVVDRFREKYHRDGTLKKIIPSPQINSPTVNNNVIQVVEFQTTKTTVSSSTVVNDSSCQRV